MVRNHGKTSILFFVILILGVFMSGAISVQQAVSNTFSNLRRRLPPVVTVATNFDGYLEWHVDEAGNWIWLEDGEEILPESYTVTVEQLEELGQLPYVQEFIFMMQTPLNNPDLAAPRFGLTSGVDFGERLIFLAYGASTPNIIYFTQGVLEIVQGRLPTEEELRGESEIIPILISQAFADLNELQVGSTFEMFSTVPGLIYRGDGVYSLSWESYEEEHALARKEVEFQIVGIFDMPSREEEFFNDMADLNLQQNLFQTLFIPLHTVETLELFQHSNQPEDPFMANLSLLSVTPIDHMFLLRDPMDIEAFQQAAVSILPERAFIQDLSNTFSAIAGPLDSLQELSHVVLIFSALATLVILGLLVVLFLNDRRHEMGIYLALGESKLKIACQILLEVMGVATVAIGISLWIGDAVADHLSLMLVREELEIFSQVEAERHWMDWMGHDSILEARGFGRQMDPDDMLAAFDTRLGFETVLLFFGIGLGTVMLSTLLPIIYTLNRSPKKVLFEEN